MLKFTNEIRWTYVFLDTMQSNWRFIYSRSLFHTFSNLTVVSWHNHLLYITGNVKYDCSNKMSVRYFVFQLLKLSSFEVSCKRKKYKFCSENSLVEGFSAKNLRKLLSCVKATVTDLSKWSVSYKRKKMRAKMRVFRQELEKNIIIFEIIFEMKFRGKQALFRYFFGWN